jgi:hypothetical protein
MEDSSSPSLRKQMPRYLSLLIVALVILVAVACNGPRPSVTVPPPTQPTVEATPTRPTSTPILTLTPTLAPPLPPRTGIVFLIDRSDSIGKVKPTYQTGYCDKNPEQQSLRYQIPEFTISLLAAYYGKDAPWLRIGVVEYAAITNTVFSLQPVSWYLNPDWRSTLYQNSHTFSERTDYVAALQAAKDELAGSDKKIIILISDGSFILVSDSQVTSDNATRTKTFEKASELLQDKNLSIIMVRLVCPDLDNVDSELPRDILGWQGKLGPTAVLADGSKAPFSSTIRALLENPVLAYLFPSKDKGWIESQADWSTQGDVWKMSVKVVSLGATYRLTGEALEEYNITSVLGMLNVFTNESDNAKRGGSCAAPYRWALTAFTNTTKSDSQAVPLTGFYWYKTDPLPFSVNVHASPTLILNNRPFDVRASVADSSYKLLIIANAECYGARLQVLDRMGEPVYSKTVMLKDSQTWGEISWRVEGYTPLTMPQTLTAEVTVVKRDDPRYSGPSNKDMVKAEFTPELVSNQSVVQCDDNRCVVTVTVRYVEASFHGQQVQPTFFALTSNSISSLSTRVAECSKGTPSNKCQVMWPTRPYGTDWYEYVFQPTDVGRWIKSAPSRDGIARTYTVELSRDLFLQWDYRILGLRWLNNNNNWPEIRCTLPTQKNGQANCEEK